MLYNGKQLLTVIELCRFSLSHSKSVCNLLPFYINPVCSKPILES